MIQSGLATLTVLSITTTPETISSILGIESTRVVLKDTVLRSGWVQKTHVWSIDSGRMDNTPDDRTGTGALRWLLERCRPAAECVALLPDDCQTRIWWSADSDSTQGGFVLPVELAAEVAALGVDVYTTIHLEDPCEDDR